MIMLSKTISKCIFLFLAIAISSLVFAQNVCQYVAGAKVVAEDGKYLGTIESKYSSDSILTSTAPMEANTVAIVFGMNMALMVENTHLHLHSMITPVLRL